ncbi:MAG: biotin-dependent carboxyltransferase family protein [Fimbriiglobus sp.]
MSVEVLSPGVFSLLVDGGRRSARALGLPIGGAADRAAFRLANALLGNPLEALALEVTLAGPTLVALHPMACVVVGAPFEIRVDAEAQLPGFVLCMQAGQRLQIGGTPTGLRAYLAVGGGFVRERVLGSAGAWGPVRTGEQLICGESLAARRGFVELPWAMPGELCELRVLLGPQRGWFPDDAFFRQTFTVSTASNRMGLRLTGTPLVKASREMTSEPVAPGAVQVANDGLPIVLGVDGQTIGGYPKPAHVIRADLDLIGRLRPGQQVRFVEVTLAEAEAAYAEQETAMAAWHQRLQWLTSVGA